MTSTRLSQFRLASDPAFVGIVKASAMRAAIAIWAEDPETPNHANRTVLANTIYTEIGQDKTPSISSFVWLAAMNPTIQASAVVEGEIVPGNVADNDVDYLVDSYFNQVAGDQ